jgi:hypothetical protein
MEWPFVELFDTSIQPDKLTGSSPLAIAVKESPAHKQAASQFSVQFTSTTKISKSTAKNFHQKKHSNKYMVPSYLSQSNSEGVSFRSNPSASKTLFKYDSSKSIPFPKPGQRIAAFLTSKADTAAFFFATAWFPYYTTP